VAAYYNEIHAPAAQTLRNLIAAGHIAPGDVDERSIEDVRPDDLKQYTQCHFFAGIGGWPLALRLAGWPDDEPIWSASCPCQPFSTAGAQLGFDDERHLWPALDWLIQQCKPAGVVGEQVSAKAVEPWVDLVHADMERLGYTFICVPFPSAGVGAPHIRDRNYWLGYANDARLQGWRRVLERITERVAGPRGVAGALAHHHHRGRAPATVAALHHTEHHVESCGRVSGLADTDFGAGRQGCAVDGRRHTGSNAFARAGSGSNGMPCERAGPTNGFWRAADWLLCRDEKWRPVEPGTFPLVDGLPRSMGKLNTGARRLAEVAGLDAASLARAKSYRVESLRGYGNAINIEAACAFIEAASEALDDYDLI
jgi:DNA (cytosine-5)-methyltransferase 1